MNNHKIGSNSNTLKEFVLKNGYSFNHWTIIHFEGLIPLSFDLIKNNCNSYEALEFASKFPNKKVLSFFKQMEKGHYFVVVD